MRTSTFLTGALIGAGAMYFFDPRMGRRRRVLIEDQLRHLSRQAAYVTEMGAVSLVSISTRECAIWVIGRWERCMMSERC